MPLTNNPGQGNLTASVFPAVELALADLRRQQPPLRNYEINFHIVDTQCDTAKGLKALFDAICFGPKYLMVFGGVCPSVTSVIAKSLQGWNLVQLSFAATTPVLDKKTYPNFFRMVTSDYRVNQAVVKILQHYRWRRVGTLVQDIQKFSEISSDLSMQLKKADVFAVTQTLSPDPCVNLKKFQDLDVTIIIGLFDENSASKVFCSVLKLNILVGRFQWIFPGGLQGKWWEDANSSRCTTDDLQTAMEGLITVDVTPLSNRQKTGISGRTPQEYLEAYNRELLRRELDSSKFHGFAYDGVWVMAKVLTNVIESIRHRERYDMFRNNTVTDKEIGEMVRDSMDKISFEGVTGHVYFRHGERMGPIKISQFQEGHEVEIGEYITEAEVLNLLHHLIRFQGVEPPKDRTQSKRWDISLSLYITLSVTTGLAMLTGVFFLFFHLKHRNHWVIKRSTPLMNYLILLGTMLSLSSVFLYGLDGSLVSDKVFETLCPIRTWTLSVGYDITLGALLAKTWRAWKTAMNMDKKKKIINNYQLQIIIGGMLLIDVCLLIHWQILDPLRRTVEEFRLEADPGGEDISVFLEHCESTNMIIWLSLSYGYKGLLMLLGCFLALRSKHAHSHLHNDDSRYTRLSVYNLTVTSVIGSSGCFLTQHNPNIQICFMTLVVIWGCTSTLCLVFVPKLIKIRDNPNEVDPSMWFQCGDKKEDSDTSASSDSLDQSIGSLESLSIENQRLRRRIAEICDELENVALQVLEEELSLSGHEVTLAAQVSCLEASTINKLLLEDINSLEQVQRRLSMQLPILHHAYIPAVGGMTVSYSNLLSSPATPCAQQSQMSPSYQVVFTGL